MPNYLRSISGRLFKNFWLKLGSLAVAVIIWIGVSSQGRADRNFMTVPYELRNIPMNMEIVDRGISFVRVTVRGPQNLISSLTPENIIIPVEIPDDVEEGEVRLTINPGNIQLPYQNQLSILQVAPTEITVSLEDSISLRLPIQPMLRGSPAKGYELSGWEVTPVNADVRGPAQTLEQLTKINTEPIDVSGVNMTFNQRVGLEPSEKLVRVVSPSRVTVTVKIQEKIIERTFPEFEVTVLLPDPDPGITIDHTVATITLKGPELAITSLQQHDISVLADCRNLLSGNHKIGLVLANAPDQIESFVTDPSIVNVTVPEFEDDASSEQPVSK
jgi:YbbR-like protein